MAEEFRFDISGIEGCCTMLSNVPALMAKNAFARAGAAAAVPVVDLLEQNSPIMEDGSIHHRPPPGALKASIVTDIAVDAQGRGVEVQIGFGRLGFVARMVEFGHQMLPHFKAKKVKGAKRSERTGSNLYQPVRADPFMRQTAEGSGEAAIEAFSESLAESFQAGIPGIPSKAA